MTTLTPELEFFSRLEITPATRALDVGCGAGQLALPAARAGGDCDRRRHRRQFD